MEVHVKEECPRRNVSCKDCGKEMHFVELNVSSIEILVVF